MKHSVGATHASPDKHHPPKGEAWRIGRRSIRLKGYDYSQEGGYSVTVDTWNRECIFGDIADGMMHLNEFGKIVDECWCLIPEHFPNVELDEFVVMPNHVHGIVVIVESRNVGARHAVPLQNEFPHEPSSHTSPLQITSTSQPSQRDMSPPQNTFPRPHGPELRSVGSIVGSFKSATTKRIDEIRRGTHAVPMNSVATKMAQLNTGLVG